MLPSIIRDPSLRCQAHSRRSGWQQCGRLRAFGSRVCTTHGARRVPRFDENAPNFKHGKRSLKNTTETTHSIQRVRLLAIGVKAMNGSKRAAEVFDRALPELLGRQEVELDRLAKLKLGRRR